jgi:beta-glucosidase
MKTVKTSNEIIKNMTLKEKIGQMTQLPPYLFIHDSEATIYGALRNLNLDKSQTFNAGSILGIGSPDEMIKLQKLYMENSTHNVPLMFMADVIHGYKTIFPVPIALASSFNFDIARVASRVSAKESYLSGIQVVFSPMCDLSRDPRWGRVVEGFGEDVYLTGEMAKAMVEGYTNYGKLGEDSVACCIKHFAGYGAAEGGRDYNTVDLSRLSLYRDYLPAYKKALDAGADLVMTSFNTLDGVPAVVNAFLLKHVLRDKWKSKALTIADYDALNQVIEHGAAKDQVEAAIKGIKAGLDIEMASSVYMNKLENLIKTNQVLESQIDEVVGRILDLKIKLNLFDNPYSGVNPEKEKAVCLSEEHLKYSKECAIESTVLLENNGVLPFNNNTKIALIGPFSKSRAFNGPWSWKGKDDVNSSLEEVLKNQLVFVSDKTKFNDFTEDELTRIKNADVCLVTLGEEAHLSGEAHSRSDISLPNDQDEFFESIKMIARKTVVLVFGGRPLLLSKVKKADALMMCWFLGSKSSEAIYDLLMGIENPSGKLPMSFPRNVGQIPIYYNYLHTGRAYVEGSNNPFVSKYLDVENTPLYPFGYGLSYAKFQYGNLSLSKKELTENDTLKISITVKNESNLVGKEVIQLYIRDYVADIVRPVKELKKIQKVLFMPQESKRIDFELGLDDLSYFDSEGNLCIESGEFSVMVGSSSESYIKEDFMFLLNNGKE